MLTQKELQQLRQEIVLGSLFMTDYTNTLGISTRKTYEFFKGYEDHLIDEARYQNMLLRNRIRKHKYTPYELDNIHELWCYYIMFENDPLAQ